MSDVQHFTSAVYPCARDTQLTNSHHRPMRSAEVSLVETLVGLHECETIHKPELFPRVQIFMALQTLMVLP